MFLGYKMVFFQMQYIIKRYTNMTKHYQKHCNEGLNLEDIKRLFGQMSDAKANRVLSTIREFCQLVIALDANKTLN